MKHKTKKLLCSVLAFCQLFAMTAFARPDWPSDTGIQAEAGALMDVDSGTMIFGQNSHVEYPPASITKLQYVSVILLITARFFDQPFHCTILFNKNFHINLQINR